MDASDVPINVAYWLMALAPIALLLVLLAVLRWKAPQAGPIGLAAGALVAVVAFRTPWETLSVGAAKGIWDAVFILFVVWPALLLYRVVDNAGGFAALREGIARYSRNDLFLVLGFGWVFASFLQGIAGFGTPIAVVAPLLLAIGVRPIYAVVIPLIGHAWANMFGTLAVGWLATLQVVNIDDLTGTAFQTGLLLWIPNLAAGLTIAWMYGRGRALRIAWPLIVVVSVIQGGGQLVLTLWDPVLSNFLAASAAMLVLYPLSRWARYSERDEEAGDSPVMAEDRSEDAEDDRAPMGLGMALAPYGVLTVVAVGVLVIAPVEDALETVEFGLPFPEVDTGYGVANGAEDPYDPIAPLTHPGAFLLVAAAAAFALYRSKGYYEQWRDAEDDVDPILPATAGDAIPASVAIVSFLALSKVMDHSGQTETLALGIAEVAPPTVFVFASTFIGVLGAFMTSSNTASNVLFAPLQQTVAEAEGLSESTIIAAQSNGGAIGNSIAPANVVLGTGTAGIVGQEGQVLRRTLPWAMAVTVLGGIAAVVLEGWL